MPPFDPRVTPPPTRAPAPPQFNPGATNPRPLATVAASRGGKEHAVPFFFPPLPLRERVPLAAMSQRRPRRGEPQSEPQSTVWGT
jgi:hypothetical protein